jgi:hypothetical protein
MQMTTQPLSAATVNSLDILEKIVLMKDYALTVSCVEKTHMIHLNVLKNYVLNVIKLVTKLQSVILKTFNSVFYAAMQVTTNTAVLKFGLSKQTKIIIKLDLLRR